MLDLVLYPKPVLREQSKPIKEITPELEQLFEDMTEAMYVYDGVGLAAPQIGESLQLAIVDVGEGPLILVNPEIIEKSEEKETVEEGCLSLPDIRVDVMRPEKCVVQALNEKGEKVEYNADGLFARALQHEIDHLNGRLIIDHASTIQRTLLRSKLKKLEKSV